MLSIHLICVGKLKEKFYLEASAEYKKRLSGYCSFTLTEIPEERLPASPSQAQIDAALEREALAIRAKIPQNSRLVCLCVEGKPRSSPELAKLVAHFAQSGHRHKDSIKNNKMHGYCKIFVHFVCSFNRFY